MNTKEKIVKAIKSRKPISFEYVRDGKVAGFRSGNPHAAFSGTTKDGADRIWVHIVQTGGVSDTSIGFPDWRTFILEYMQQVTILEDEPEFIIHEDYRPDSEMYVSVLAKV
jgi:hypothetical protein